MKTYPRKQYIELTVRVLCDEKDMEQTHKTVRSLISKVLSVKRFGFIILDKPQAKSTEIQA